MRNANSRGLQALVVSGCALLAAAPAAAQPEYGYINQSVSPTPRIVIVDLSANALAGHLDGQLLARNRAAHELYTYNYFESQSAITVVDDRTHAVSRSFNLELQPASGFDTRSLVAMTAGPSNQDLYAIVVDSTPGSGAYTSWFATFSAQSGALKQVAPIGFRFNSVNRL